MLSQKHTIAYLLRSIFGLSIILGILPISAFGINYPHVPIYKSYILPSQTGSIKLLTGTISTGSVKISTGIMLYPSENNKTRESILFSSSGSISGSGSIPSNVSISIKSIKSKVASQIKLSKEEQSLIQKYPGEFGIKGRRNIPGDRSIPKSIRDIHTDEYLSLRDKKDAGITLGTYETIFIDQYYNDFIADKKSEITSQTGGTKNSTSSGSALTPLSSDINKRIFRARIYDKLLSGGALNPEEKMEAKKIFDEREERRNLYQQLVKLQSAKDQGISLGKTELRLLEKNSKFLTADKKALANLGIE